MPHVIVHFDPTVIDQQKITELKLGLPSIVARALSYLNTEDTQVPAHDIYVRQAEAHPTDQNAPAVEIEVQAGCKKGRDEEHVTQIIVEGVLDSGEIHDLVDVEVCCVWVRFSEHNGFKRIT